MAPKASAGKAIQQAPPASSRSRHASPSSGQRFAQAPAFGPFSTALGNQAMLSLLESGQIQAKLRVSRPEDPDELEADRVASQVMSASSSGAKSPRPVLPTFQPSAPALHRKCACSGSGTKCAQCEEEEVEAGKGIHRKASPGSKDTSAAPDSLLHGLGSGHALEPPLRKSMESRFGQDFSGVRIHDDPAAAQSAKSINAQAYTFGSDIYFGSGSYAPQSAEGQRLLAHELVHVVQQRGRDHGITSTKSSSDTRISRKNDSTNTVTGPAGPPGCTIDQSRVIVPAANLSLQWLDKSAAALSRFIAAPADKSNKAASTALQLHFHSADPGIAQRVLDRIRMIRNDIGLPRGRTELTTQCHSDADTNCHNAGAYVSANTNNLVFCPAFFKGGAQWQAEALIHEMAHSIFPQSRAHIADRAYRSDRAILRLSTTEALTNAESFALFVEELGTGKIQESAAPKDEIPDNCKDIDNSLRDAIARAQRWNFNADTDVLNSASTQSVQQALGSDTPQVRKTAQTFYSNADKGFSEEFEFKCVADCGGRAARGEQKSHWLAGLGIGAAIGGGIGALIGLIPGIGILAGAIVGAIVGAGLGLWAGHSSKIRRIQVCPAWRSLASSPAGTEAILAAAYEALGNSTADSLKYAKLAAAIQSLHPAAGTLQEIDLDAFRHRLIIVQARLRELKAQYQKSRDAFANAVIGERMGGLGQGPGIGNTSSRKRRTPDDSNFDPEDSLEQLRGQGEAKLAEIRKRRQRVESTVESLNLAEEIIKLEAEEKNIQAKLATAGKP